MRVGPEPLAAGREQVAGDLGEEPVVGADRVAERVLDPAEVVGQRRESDVVERGGWSWLPHGRPSVSDHA